MGSSSYWGPGHLWYLEQLVYDWNNDLAALLKGVPEEMRVLAGSVDADEAYDDLLTMFRKGKGPRREVVQKNPRLADKLEAVEADIWSEVDSDLKTDAKALRRNLKLALSKALVQTRLVGKNLRRAYAMDRTIRNDIDLVALRLKRMGLPYVAKQFKQHPLATGKSWKPLVEDQLFMGNIDRRDMNQAMKILWDWTMNAKDQGHQLKPVRFSTAASRVASRYAIRITKSRGAAMPKPITTTDRKQLIRLASSMEKGSEGRRAILAGLQKSAAGEVGPYIEFDGKVWVSSFGDTMSPTAGKRWSRVTIANKKTGAPGKKEYQINWLDNGELSLFKSHRSQPVFKWKDLGHYPIPYTAKDFRADYKGYKSEVEPLAKTLAAEIKKKGGGAEMARGFAADVAEDVNFHSLSRALGGTAPEGLSMDEQDVGAKLRYNIYGAAFFALALAKVFRDKSMAEVVFRAMKESEERSQRRGGREMMRERGFR